MPVSPPQIATDALWAQANADTPPPPLGASRTILEAWSAELVARYGLLCNSAYSDYYANLKEPVS